jgi:hypothetical protein
LSNSIIKPFKSDHCFDIPFAFNKEGRWFCELGINDKSPSFFVFGDSHALNLITALDSYGVMSNQKILFSSLGTCPALLEIQPFVNTEYEERHNCKLLNDRIFNYVQNNNIKNVVLVGRWTNYGISISRPLELHLIYRSDQTFLDVDDSDRNLHSSLKYTVQQFKKIGVNVYIAKDTPQQILNSIDALKKSSFSRDEILINQLSVSLNEHQRNQAVINNLINSLNVNIIDLDSVLCGESICPLVNNDQFIYYDDDHLSNFGTKKIAPKVIEDLYKGARKQ